MSLMVMGPRELTSATEEPETPPKNMESTTLTMARPPGIQPTRHVANSSMLSAMEPMLMNSPISMKQGTASRE